MIDKTEMLSFLNADKIHSVSDVTNMYIDLKVVANILIGIMADGSEVSLGSWPGDTVDELETLAMAPDALGITNTMVSGEVVQALPSRTINRIPSKTVGKGEHTRRYTGKFFNHNPEDHYDESDKIAYAIASDEPLTTSTQMNVVTDLGVQITSTSLWSAGYNVLKTTNRAIANNSDGALSSTTTLTLTHTYPEPVILRGYLWENLRPDYTGSAYVVEYSVDGTNWIEFDAVDYSGDLMAPRQKIVEVGIECIAVRWNAVPGGTPGVGRFDVLVSSSKYTEYFEEIEFHPDYFDVTEGADTINVVQKDLPGNVLSGTPIGLNNYIRTKSVLEPGETKRALGMVGEVIPLTKIEVDTIGTDYHLPYIELPPGSYLYLLTVNISEDCGMGRYYLGYPNTDIPLAPPHLLAGTATLTGKSLSGSGTGELDLFEPTKICVKRDSTLGAEYSGAGFTDQVVACLEIWQVSSTPVFVETVPPAKPVPEMVAADWTIVGKQLNDTADTDRLKDGILGGVVHPAGSGMDLTNPGDYIRIKVDQPFRWWVTTEQWVSPPILTSEAYGNINLTASHLLPLVNSPSTWQQFSKDLPPGIYRLDKGAASHVHLEWFFEKVSAPVYNPQVLTYQVAPMATNNEQNQIVEASSSYGAAYEGHQVFGAVVSTGGWVTALDTLPSVGSPAWVSIEFTDGPRQVTGFVLTNRLWNDQPNYVQAPVDFELQGWDGSNWITCHSVTGRTELLAGESTDYQDIGNHLYSKYRLLVTKAGAGIGTYLTVGALKLYSTNKKYPAGWIK